MLRLQDPNEYPDLNLAGWVGHPFVTVGISRGGGGIAERTVLLMEWEFHQ